ncbi:MAG: phospho-N-acetylmuramoyl-pentapeptide-transferase [Rikenellaceae bacterium]|nr:phospho-N-acetylmuramoyl-pentapeptide-transferase [Rikenellaceae bacterium]
MLYHLIKWLDGRVDIPGSGLFQYLSFRAAMAIILALLIGMIFGRKVIDLLRRKQIGEDIRELGLHGQMEKKGTPTMGGIVILGSVLVPILLFGNLTNIYVQLMILSTLWLGTIGFLDDYIKVFRKNKAGLRGRFKIFGQVGLGIIVGTIMCFNSNIVVKEKVEPWAPNAELTEVGSDGGRTVYLSEEGTRTKTTIPFVKNNEFDYHWFFASDTTAGNIATWIIYILAAIFIITAVSNGANLTDGLDGLSAGVSALVVFVLGVLAYVGGNVIYADYLNIMYIPSSGELVVFAAAFLGALIGFIWYNCYPAQVFMGDTGSLAIGGMIAVFALLIRKELLLPILCGVFLVEGMSVIVQVAWFKYTKRKYGEGRRVFLMSPLHHHYQIKGYPEAKITVRFWIIQLLLAAITLVTLKIR